MANQSFRQVFVTNTPVLLAQGQTVDALAVDQIGLLNAKTNTGVTAPTYATAKALLVVQGTPDLSGGSLMDGNYDGNDYSKLIVGKNITNFRGKAARRGRNQIITIGNSGDVSDTDTLFAKVGEARYLYLTLTGSPIDKLFTTQGITRTYIFPAEYGNDCVDSCANIDSRLIQEYLIKQINADNQINRFVKASAITQYSTPPTPPTTQTVYKFQLRVADTQDAVALGLVQAQYPDDVVKRIGTEGILSVYEVVRATNTVPDDYSNSGIVVIPNCDVCPAGYALQGENFVYTVTRSDAGDGTALTTVASNYSISGTGETVARIAYQYGQSTYVVSSSTAINAAIGVDGLSFIGQSRSTCVLTDPTEFEWAAAGTALRYPKVLRLTIGDDECGSDRLAELQAFYEDLTISLVDADGDCVHTYETTIYSEPVDDVCSVSEYIFVRPQAFDGVFWYELPPTPLADGVTVLTGIKIEVAYVDRQTNECTFDYFPYEQDTVHVNASTIDPDWNHHPATGYPENEWKVKNIQSVQYPSGYGRHVQLLEKESKGYALRERSFNPVIREQQGYHFAAQSNVYYDEYVIEFDYKVHVGGWAQEDKYKYSLHIYFPEGYGKSFETAINNYLASAAIDIEPVIL